MELPAEGAAPVGEAYGQVNRATQDAAEHDGSAERNLPNRGAAPSLDRLVAPSAGVYGRNMNQIDRAAPAGVPGIASTDEILREVLGEVLGLSTDRVARFDLEDGLFGHMPELDSMAVATLLTEIEDRFDVVIDDDEVEGEMLETYGALLTFVEAKREGR